jgi:hypothetical protein
MSTSEGSFASLLQGVSQQIARERLPGQLTAQDNMMSDPVSGLRRRPGVEYRTTASAHGAPTDAHIKGFFTDIGNTSTHVLLNSFSGHVTLLAAGTYAPLAELQSDYLKASSASRLRVASVGSELYIANLEKQPTAVVAGPSALQQSARGFFYIRAGTYSKVYNVTVQAPGSNDTHSYKTPDGTTAGDVDKATPEYIALQLANAVNAISGVTGISASVTGAYVYVDVTAFNRALTLSSDSGVAFIQTSGNRFTRLDTDLPARLPDAANGMIMATGSQRAPTYYRYDSASFAWVEDGGPGSPSYLTNMPVSISIVFGVGFAINTANYEGRFAGDDDSNAPPPFLSAPLTGMGSYQNRLVLLCGPMVSMSASNNPRRMFRSTVTSLKDDDPIHIGASGNSSAAYEYALPFQKDLMLFSSRYQALVPSGNLAVTPRTAAVVITSKYEADTTCEPVTLGRTLMYPFPRSVDFFGLLEMLPSQYTDSQYISNDSTAHLPKYMAGRCRFAVSSSVANMVMFGPTNEKKALIVHEYFWDGDDKKQQAWHRWTFPYDVADAYFSGSSIVTLFKSGNTVLYGTLDPRAGSVSNDADRRPFLDFYGYITIAGNAATLPAWTVAFDAAFPTKMDLVDASGPLAGEAVGFTASGASITTVRSQVAGRAAFGIPFQSAVSPTSIMIVDENGVKVSTNKLTVLRYIVSTANSSEYKAIVRDSAHEGAGEDVDVGTLYFSSEDLQIGRALIAGQSAAIIPARTYADTTTLVLYTEGAGEMNIVGIEYLVRFYQKITRR